MDNLGVKRGFNNDSGFLYSMQGNTQLGGPIQLPVYTMSRPRYINDENKKFFLKYSNDYLNKVKKEAGPYRIKLPETVPQDGGELTKNDYNNI